MLRKRFLRTLLICAFPYLLVTIGCAVFQRRLIYFPPACDAAAVRQRAQSERLEQWIDPSGELIGWKRPSPVQPAKGQLVILHGNACCAFQCGYYADAFETVAPLDAFIVEYPGYGGRAGKPSERTLDQSADEALQLLATNKPIYLLGESLGTGVATYLAGRYPGRVAGVILLAPYNRLTDVAQAHMPIFPVRWMLVDRFPSEDYLSHYTGPVAMLVAGRDKVVPERFGRRLYDSYTGPKRIWEFPEADHETVRDQPASLWKQVVEFWTEHATKRQ